ncbi:hypothetical protein EV424DRAFT_1349897 [Suillus variegatus]|nr:hypothetical protein EV424DRAFT_1349897 [Suillus variegatus]
MVRTGLLVRFSCGSVHGPGVSQNQTIVRFSVLPLGEWFDFGILKLQDLLVSIKCRGPLTSPSSHSRKTTASTPKINAPTKTKATKTTEFEVSGHTPSFMPSYFPMSLGIETINCGTTTSARHVTCVFATKSGLLISTMSHYALGNTASPGLLGLGNPIEAGTTPAPSTYHPTLMSPPFY